MVPTARALILCVFFLFRLDETVEAQRGHCTVDKCFAFFLKPSDFSGAQKGCKDTGGRLFAYNSANKAILSNLNGSYWLETSSTGERKEEAALQNCSSIFVPEGQNFEVTWEPCPKKLDGFLCEYGHIYGRPCRPIKTGRGAQVTYSTPMGFEAENSEVLPSGTVAVVGRIGEKFLDSKHVCLSDSWLGAPWSCEVMGGGCEHKCSSAPHTCICPAGEKLHPNNVTCTTDLCAGCAHECQPEGDTFVCTCRKGYRLAPDRKTCVDVDECKEETPCTGVGRECENTLGGFRCVCTYDFAEEDGVCVNMSICGKCEHGKCEKHNGVYQCGCRKGYRVNAKDPTKCDQYCAERECLAECLPKAEGDGNAPQCYCPDGFIHDTINNTVYCTDINECAIERQCAHKCENFFGGYRCVCDPGFKPYKVSKCIPEKQDVDVDDEEEGSGFNPSLPTPASAHPAPVPPYIKTGSVLGVSVFVVLFAALLYFLTRHMVKRCGNFQLSSLKHHDIDIFYLQQATTGTYKRFSFDRQLKNDPEII